MASIKDFFKFFTGKPEIKETTQKEEYLQKPISISSDEFRLSKERLSIENKKINLNKFMDYVAEKHETISKKIELAKKIKELAPDIEDAFEILTASILSPNNFMKRTITFDIDNDTLTHEQKISIIKLLESIFMDKLDLDDKLYDWVKKIIGESGAVPILILPQRTLEKIIDIDTKLTQLENPNIKHPKTAFEQFLQANGIYNIALENISINEWIFNDMVQDIKLELYKIAEESLIQIQQPGQLSKSNNGNNNQLFKNPTLDKKIETTIKQLQKEINFTVINDFSALNYKIHNYRKTKKSIIQQKEKYRQILSNILDIEDILELGGNYPILMELPTESVIPIYVDRPYNHIGYFILLDENGYPIRYESKQHKIYEELEHMTNSFIKTDTKSLVNDLYRMFGIKTLGSNKKLENQLSLILLTKYIEHVLKGQLTNLGLINIDFKFNNNVLKICLYNILKKRRIYAVYVPAYLLHYLAIEYNDDGTGKSKIDDIEFILTIRIMVLMVQLFNLMESAIRKEKINIKFSKDVSNVVELMHKIRNIFINKKFLNFSYEPAKILKTLAERSVTINPVEIDGIETFEITSEPGAEELTSIDETIEEKVNNWLIYKAGIPPHVMNNLSENEYSRSVATNNLLFSLRLSKYQKPVIKFLNKFVKSYLIFSDKLKEKIQDIIQPSDQKEKNMITEETILNIINDIEVSLPPPKIAFDKAMADELKEYTDALESVISSMLPDEISPDDDLKDIIGLLRAIIKYNALLKYLRKSNVIEEFEIDDIKHMDRSILLEFYSILKNIKTGIENYKEELDKKLGGESGGGTSGGGSTGGGFGGGGFGF